MNDGTVQRALLDVLESDPTQARHNLAVLHTRLSPAGGGGRIN